MHTTGIIHHFSHSDMYTNTSYVYIQLDMAHSPYCEFPLLVPFSTYLAPSRCDRNGPPQSQVARKLIPFVPQCSLVPSPPNSQPFLGFPELNVHLIRATSQTLFPVYNTEPLLWFFFLYIGKFLPYPKLLRVSSRWLFVNLFDQYQEARNLGRLFFMSSECAVHQPHWSAYSRLWIFSCVMQ